MTERITLAHGSGGRMTQQLIQRVFGSRFSNPLLDRLNDAAVGDLADSGRLVFSIDGHVVSPLFFPGGSIGDIAVYGTVNDLAMMGARPLWLAASFIIEEGLPMADLSRIADDMAAAAKGAGVWLVAGDTKVVERGKGDGVYISVAGVGIAPEHLHIDASNAQPGDVILINGPIAAHGMTIMTLREGLGFESALKSDAAPLHGIVADLLQAAPHVHAMRDATRGGLATALNELAQASGVGILFQEGTAPVDEAAASACALLGLDPLYVANEGVFIALVPPEEADAALAAMRAHPLGRQAAQIGRVTAAHPGKVIMETALGAKRIVPMLSGDLLPRIC
ncbi:MAG TPA: hydrogenase expression/formation protein HypE [Anaerolineae bacterium]|nr:hydrogenase expression/formation protein HypE [Caldilineae bacterium]HID33320.1 hydrogenase expression/formation protein HypE [Anaerolineae bacterium]